MKTIYKYPIKIADEQFVDMPIWANIISVQMQNEIAIIWAMVSTKEILTSVKIRIFGTGEELPNASILRHIGSVQDRGYVWHIFIDDTASLNPITN